MYCPGVDRRQPVFPYWNDKLFWATSKSINPRQPESLATATSSRLEPASFTATIPRTTECVSTRLRNSNAHPPLDDVATSYSSITPDDRATTSCCEADDFNDEELLLLLPSPVVKSPMTDWTIADDCLRRISISFIPVDVETGTAGESSATIVVSAASADFFSSCCIAVVAVDVAPAAAAADDVVVGAATVAMIVIFSSWSCPLFSVLSLLQEQIQVGSCCVG
mmetsp:Transcript_31775/g.77142  ORF Transcript_31775/g.77142 Transcript_31775/m.77142 type:complete len:223 (+) Transcript_31775:3652-4320(+)